MTPEPPAPWLRAVVGAAMALAAALIAALTVASDTAAARDFSDAAIAEGVLATVFGGETRHPGEPYVRKFVGPVRYSLISTSRVDRRRQVRRYIAQLARTVQNLTFHETAEIETARLRIYLVDRSDYAATIQATAWAGTDTAFLRRNDCAAVLAATHAGIVRALVYLAADDADSAFAHCLAEEVAQSLGPANDSDALADSIFNDRSQINEFGRFDWLILNVLYDERVRPGMSEAQLRPLLPVIIRDVRGRKGPATLGPPLP